ncbi:PQQ-like beta-propeller repeat protein [Limimaricola sp.]|uniref:PQQ-like beta-propeller repeat protein n=1 Tax=Limimaricola sp. TaxID=2211665 RepID=UPI0025B92506|nr:PQQ-like beta-propeller repeat protein [Limimaricola sp.]
MTARFLMGALLTCSLLAACGEKDTRLPGERLDVRNGMTGAAEAPQPNRAPPLRLAAAVTNAEWAQRAGGATHNVAQPALASSIAPVWTVNLGEGDGRRQRITADPVVGGGLVYAMDARAKVSAVGLDGAVRWVRDLAPPGDAGSSSGGGLAFSDGKLFVSTDYGQVIALDASTGATLWTQELGAAAGAAPTVAGGLVYVVARDARAWAINVSDGRVRWALDGTPAQAAYGGGTGPAVTGSVAVLPFPSGQVVAAYPRGGEQQWSSYVAGERVAQAVGPIQDISSDPVIDGGRVYVGNAVGRLEALDLGTGAEIWTADEGAVGPVWPAGGSIFIVSDNSELMRLDARNGQTIWRVSLPGFVASKERRQNARFVHFGPVLAGGRLIVASSDGQIRSFDPVSGALVSTVAVPGGATAAPAVAQGMMFVVTTRGQLVAFR